jgi:hypothetical protein
MRIPEQRAQRDAELAAAEQAQRELISAFVQKALPARTAKQFAGIEASAARMGGEVAALSRAAQQPMKDRLQQLLVHQVAVLRGILLEEVARLEERSTQRLAALKADADEAAKVRSSTDSCAATCGYWARSHARVRADTLTVAASAW